MQKFEGSKSRLLTNEKPIIALPSLIKVFGFNGALILQQIFYWMTVNKENSKNYIEGSYWVRITVEEIAKQLYISESSVKRSLRQLEKEDAIKVNRYNKWKNDNTKWYTINFDVIGAISELSPGCFDTFEQVKMNRALQESRKRFNEEDNNGMDISNQNAKRDHNGAKLRDSNNRNKTIQHFITIYCESLYKRHKKHSHPYMSKDNLRKVHHNLLDFSIEFLGLEIDDETKINEEVLDKLVLMSEAFFTNVHKSDHSLLHFSESNILMNRFYEAGII